MPIKGLTDRQASFPQIGILRKGDAKKDEKRPGADLTYFRLDTNDEAVERAFRTAYGAEPRDVNCFLPFKSTDENFQTSQEAWTAGALQHRCDGETCSIWLKDDGTYSQAPKPCPGGCKPQGRLKIIVSELRRLAYVVVMTTSLHDIITLNENLQAYEMLRGDLRGIPLILKRRPRMVSTPGGNGKRVRREKWLLSIEAAPIWVNAQLSAMQQAALPGGQMLELEAPDDDDGDYIEAKALPAPAPSDWLPGKAEFKAQTTEDFGLHWDEIRRILKEECGFGEYSSELAQGMYKCLAQYVATKNAALQSSLFADDAPEPTGVGNYSE